VDRGGERVAVTVVAGRLPGLEQAGMGITSQTIEEEVVLPVAVDLVDQNRIGGPSAGLMIALTVYDLVAEEDLATGRRIAGTGTIDANGTVGRVGSVREKTIAAIADGFEVLLVPASQAADARAAADGALEVIGVATIDDAIAALR
jgi:Lon-like protease